MKGLPEAWSKDSSAATGITTGSIGGGSTNNMSRPNSLFGQHHQHSIGAPESQDLKDLYLQDLSDGSI